MSFVNEIRITSKAFSHFFIGLSISKSISEVGENFTEEHYILMCEYICEAFGNQFTTDELMDGLYQDQIFSTFQEVVQEVTDRINGKMVNVAKN